jgi:MarR family transcriptional regulator for hemolysin
LIRFINQMIAVTASEAGLDVEQAIVLTLLDLANHLNRNAERLARLGGLTAQQWLLLRHVARRSHGDEPSAEGGVLASDIALARGVSRSNVSALLAGLLDRGLVRQIEDPHDRRRRKLVPTPAGLRALEEIEPARQAANRELLRPLDVAERARLLSSLQRCLSAAARREETPR